MCIDAVGAGVLASHPSIGTCGHPAWCAPLARAPWHPAIGGLRLAGEALTRFHVKQSNKSLVLELIKSFGDIRFLHPHSAHCKTRHAHPAIDQ